MYEAHPMNPNPGTATYTGATTYGGTPMTPNSQPPVAPIGGTMLSLEKHVTHLHEMLSELERRLEPILTPTSPQPASNQTSATAVQAGSSHQMALANLGFAVMTGVERVNRILGRLEI